MLKAKLRWWRGLMRLSYGYCPICNSSPPRKSCPVCFGSHVYGYELSTDNRLIWKNRFAVIVGEDNG